MAIRLRSEIRQDSILFSPFVAVKCLDFTLGKIFDGHVANPAL